MEGGEEPAGRACRPREMGGVCGRELDTVSTGPLFLPYAREQSSPWTSTTASTLSDDDAPAEEGVRRGARRGARGRRRRGRRRRRAALSRASSAMSIAAPAVAAGDQPRHGAAGASSRAARVRGGGEDDGAPTRARSRRRRAGRSATRRARASPRPGQRRRRPRASRASSRSTERSAPSRGCGGGGGGASEPRSPQPPSRTRQQDGGAAAPQPRATGHRPRCCGRTRAGGGTSSVRREASGIHVRVARGVAEHVALGVGEEEHAAGRRWGLDGAARRATCVRVGEALADTTTRALTELQGERGCLELAKCARWQSRTARCAPTTRHRPQDRVSSQRESERLRKLRLIAACTLRGLTTIVQGLRSRRHARLASAMWAPPCSLRRAPRAGPRQSGRGGGELAALGRGALRSRHASWPDHGGKAAVPARDFFEDAKLMTRRRWSFARGVGRRRHRRQRSGGRAAAARAAAHLMRRRRRWARRAQSFIGGRSAPNRARTTAMRRARAELAPTLDERAARCRRARRRCRRRSRAARDRARGRSPRRHRGRPRRGGRARR